MTDASSSSAETSSKRMLTILVLYHPGDRQKAKQLREILTPQRGFNCLLLYEKVASDVFKYIFKLSKEADCVISLLTKELFDAEDVLQYHRKVQAKLHGENYIPINIDVPKSVIDSEEAGFLIGCNILNDMWLSEEFKDHLLTVLSSVQPREETSPKTASGKANATLQPTQTGGVPVTGHITPHGSQMHPVCSFSSCNRGLSAPGNTPVQANSGIHRSNTFPGMPAAPHTSATTGVLCNCASYAAQPSGSVQMVCGSPQRGQLHVTKYPLNGGQLVARNRLLSQEAAREYLRREKRAQFLRSPFIVPILAVDDKNGLGLLQEIITPYMCNGTMEDLLNPECTTIFKTWLINRREFTAHLVTTVYQVSEAIDFLHSRGFVHGNVNPRKIFMDCRGNARLGDFRKSHRVPQMAADQKFEARKGYDDPYTTRACFEGDIFAFGIILLQVLKWSPAVDDKCTLYGRLIHHYNNKLPKAEELIADSRYVEKKMWPEDRITRSLCQAVVDSLKLTRPADRIRAVDIRQRLSKCMTTLQLKLMHFPEQKCVNCMAPRLNSDLKAESPGCSEKCEFTQICPSCLQLAYRNHYVCPCHRRAEIRSPIGGDRAYALIIQGSDLQSEDTEEQFQEDCRKMTLAAAHPRIFGIPRQNIYQISPHRNSTLAHIRRLLKEIAAKRPASFFMYISGHSDPDSNGNGLIVRDGKKKSTLSTDEIRRLCLEPLVHITSKMLIIEDSCKAAAMKLFPQLGETDNDRHVAWHIEWPSCGRQENSNIEPNSDNSAFTKFLLAGLMNSSRCPNGGDVLSCPDCSKYRDMCVKTQCVSFTKLDKYVRSHMRHVYQEGREDTQRPIVRRHSREEPIIAYFAQQPLYQFQYVRFDESDEVDECVCALDYIAIDMDLVLVHLWSKLKEKCLPKHSDHHILQIFQRSQGRTKHLSEPDEILDAVYDDEQSLFVTVRTDETKLNVEKWVVCWCQASETADAIRHLNARPTSTTRAEGGTVLNLSELSVDWKPNQNSKFEKALSACWDSFCRIRQVKNIPSGDTESFMTVEIRDTLSMFRVTIPPDVAQETKVLQ